jgi:hypothetical protein
VLRLRGQSTHVPRLALFQPSRAGLLQRNCACGGTDGKQGGCAKCRQKKESFAGPALEGKSVSAPVAERLPADLAVGEPGDRYEQEADRVADQVLGMRLPAVLTPVPVLQPSPDDNSEVAVGQDQPAPDEMDTTETAQTPSPGVSRYAGNVLQRRCAGDGSAVGAQQSARQTPPMKSGFDHWQADGGELLSASARAFFESRFGHVFDHVRVHTDNRAAESARAFNALAYTVGHHIVFASGQYDPESMAGRRLLAHELTHVLQQNAPPTQPSVCGLPNGPVRVQPLTMGQMTLQRWSVDGPAVATLNTIVCDGSGGVRVQLGGTGNADQTRCLSDCMRSHELSHRADVLAVNADICKDKADGSQVNTAAGDEQKATEIKASNAEIDCLTPQIPRVGEVCKKIIQDRVTQMRAFRDSFR